MEGENFSREAMAEFPVGKKMALAELKQRIQANFVPL